jgi:hypothetical protein
VDETQTASVPPPPTRTEAAAPLPLTRTVRPPSPAVTVRVAPTARDRAAPSGRAFSVSDRQAPQCCLSLPLTGRVPGPTAAAAAGGSTTAAAVAASARHRQRSTGSGLATGRPGAAGVCAALCGDPSQWRGSLQPAARGGALSASHGGDSDSDLVIEPGSRARRARRRGPRPITPCTRDRPADHRPLPPAAISESGPIRAQHRG